MFDIGWGELLVIGVVALIAIGPKELPGVLRTVGQWMGKIRRMASEFQGQFNDAMREAELHDLKKHVDDIASTASSVTNFDPMESVRKEIDSMHDGLNKAVGDNPLEAKPEAAASPSPADAPPAAPSSEAPPAPAPQPAADIATPPAAPSNSSPPSPAPPSSSPPKPGEGAA